MEVIFNIPIYNVTVKIIFCDNIQDYCENIYNQRPKKTRATLFDFLEEDDETLTDFVLLLQKDDLCEAVLNHEAFHITYRTLKNAGITLTTESEEAFAYLNDYVYIALRKKVIKWKSENLIEQKTNGNTDSSKEVRKTTVGAATMEG